MVVSEKVDTFLNSEYGSLSSAIYRDLSLNFKKILEESSLQPQEGFLILLSIAVALENKSMVAFAKSVLTSLEIPVELIQEAAETAGIMGMNNVYYKFKSYLPAEVASDYQRAGLRLNSVSKTLNTKKDFEMMALAVSIINGCSICVASHEKSARTHGVDVNQIHDLARLAAVAKGLHSLKKALVL